jgi:hypothetical protein
MGNFVGKAGTDPEVAAHSTKGRLGYERELM